MAFETQRHRLTNAQQARAVILSVCEAMKPWLLAGHQLSLEVKAETRSTAQSRLMWSCLNDLARQIDWHGQKLAAEDWKEMATAALKKQRVVPGLEGGFVVLGSRTSKMTKAEMSELIDFLHALGDDKGVQWSQTSLGREWSMEPAC